MPFLRPGTVRTAAIAVVCAALLVPVAPAQAEPAAATAATPATALPAGAGAAVFCPSPTGSWWDDLSARGCVELLAGRDRLHPITRVELGWLDLGDLPAHATVDLDAIAATLAAFDQRLAEEAAEADVAPRAPTRTATPAPRTVRSRRAELLVPSFEELERMMSDCGIGPEHDGFLSEHPCIAAAWAEIVASVPVPQVPSYADPSAPASEGAAADWRTAKVTALNALRGDVGAPPLDACPALARIAQDYAVVLADWGRISHTGPDGSSPLDRALRGGFISVGGSENLAITTPGRSGVGDVLERFLESGDHRENMLDPQWRQVGLGLARDAGGRSYWVQLFGIDGDCG